MSVCIAKKCEKRELCMNYIDNYFEYNPNSGTQQVIDWSGYGSNHWCDKDGDTYTEQTWDCGDLSKTYPKFEPIE